jgi:D-glycero-D-manno-heptose 1,7-bisphosphate phosphatase
MGDFAADSSQDAPWIEQELKTNLLRIVFSDEERRTKGPAIFIDRDGVINCRRPGDYVLDWSQFVFIPGIRAALKQIASLGLPMIVISNQAAVGKGLLDLNGLRGITAQMHQSLVADGTYLSAAYYCTHRPDEECICRKPKPELLRRAADDFNIDLSRSAFIGDSETDVRAARAAGCAPVVFGKGLTNHSESQDWLTNLLVAPVAEDLFNVVAKSLQGRGTRDHAVR